MGCAGQKLSSKRATSESKWNTAARGEDHRSPADLQLFSGQPEATLSGGCKGESFDEERLSDFFSEISGLAGEQHYIHIQRRDAVLHTVNRAGSVQQWTKQRSCCHQQPARSSVFGPHLQPYKEHKPC